MKTGLRSSSLGSVGQDFSGNTLGSKVLSKVCVSPEGWRNRDPQVGRGGGRASGNTKSQNLSQLRNGQGVSACKKQDKSESLHLAFSARVIILFPRAQNDNQFQVKSVQSSGPTNLLEHTQHGITILCHVHEEGTLSRGKQQFVSDILQIVLKVVIAQLFRILKLVIVI